MAGGRVHINHTACRRNRVYGNPKPRGNRGKRIARLQIILRVLQRRKRVFPHVSAAVAFGKRDLLFETHKYGVALMKHVDAFRDHCGLLPLLLRNEHSRQNENEEERNQPVHLMPSDAFPLNFIVIVSKTEG